MSFLFEKLDVYQKAVIFAKDAITVSENLPKGNSFLSDQLKRAALSISLNIAEGNGRFYKKELLDDLEVIGKMLSAYIKNTFDNSA